MYFCYGELVNRLYLHSDTWIWPGGSRRLEKLHLIQVTCSSQLPSLQGVLRLFMDEAMATSLCCHVTERIGSTSGGAKALLAALLGQSAIPYLLILTTQGSCGVTASLALFLLWHLGWPILCSLWHILKGSQSLDLLDHSPTSLLGEMRAVDWNSHRPWPKLKLDLPHCKMKIVMPCYFSKY